MGSTDAMSQLRCSGPQASHRSRKQRTINIPTETRGTVSSERASSTEGSLCRQADSKFVQRNTDLLFTFLNVYHTSGRPKRLEK